MVVSFENEFYRITENNEVFFPLWDKLTFSEFWLEYLRDRNKYTIICACRGAGKTWHVIFKEIYYGLSYYTLKKASGVQRRAGAQYNIIIVAPTKESYAPIVQYVEEMLPRIPGYAEDGKTLNYRKRNSNGKADFRLFGDNEFLISIYSSFDDASSLRGKGCDSLILEEAFMISRKSVEDVLIQVVNRQGNFLGRLTVMGTPDTEDLPDPWFDQACDEADTALPDRQGFFSKFKLYSSTWLANPFTSEELRQAILWERQINPLKYRRERMAERGLVIQEHFTEGEVFSGALLEKCYYLEKPTVASTRNLLVTIDTAYGGSTDAMVRLVFDKATNRYVDITIVEGKSIRDASDNQEDRLQTVCQFFLDTAKLYPFAQIVYDKSGRMGQSLPLLLPSHLNLIPVDRGNKQKNSHVEAIQDRMAYLNEQGKCDVIQFPHLDAKWLTPRQRECFKRLYTEMVNYVRENTTNKFGEITGYRYTKNTAKGYTDDCVDALTIGAHYMNPIRRERKVSVINARRKFL